MAHGQRPENHGFAPTGMYFDDRLATVLRHRAASDRDARTQFRQLIDLLGERPQAGDRSLKAAAYLRLIALAEVIPVEERAAIVSEAGWRFRNPELVKWFGEAHPTLAAAALYRARLSGQEWEALIPRLPIRARGFLRHRRDLPEEAVAVLDRLGVQDRALPLPEPMALIDEPAAPVSETQTPAPFRLHPVAHPALGADDAGGAEDDADGQPEVRSDNFAATAPLLGGEAGGVRALVERIEQFQKSRARQPGPARAVTGDEAPPLPLAGLDREPAPRAVDAFSFSTDGEGRIDWADGEVAAMVIGRDLAAAPVDDDAEIGLGPVMAKRQPIAGALLSLRGGPAIAGSWIVDAAPRFTRGEGRYCGYVGRMRRAVDAAPSRAAAGADRLRQLLHELRTPVTAMQGYAEVIQQQVFGPTPHEYRALAAAIAGDSARILAGFEELDRLARLETGALEIEQGEADFTAILRRQVVQLQSVLSPRVARFLPELDDCRAVLPLAETEAEMLAWRVLATLAGTTGAGESVALMLLCEGARAILRAQLPASLAAQEDIFAADTRGAGSTLSAGIFGAGFSLRLARAEARAAGGSLVRDGQWLVIELPLHAAHLPFPEVAAGPGDRALG